MTPIAHLNSAMNIGDRKGALLKLQWPDGLIGYSDLHPWPELGDDSLDKQISDLKRGRLTPMVEQSIWLARRDAVARRDKKNLLDTTIRLKNNFIISDIGSVQTGLFDELRKEGFTQIKLKVGKDLEKERDFVTLCASAGFKLRLDFNSSGNWQIFEKFFTGIPKSAMPAIDYVEDPFGYDPLSWTEARKLVKVAIDHEYPKVDWANMKKPAFDVVIVKPAKMDVTQALDRCFQFQVQATITSYMDHPVGMVHALAVANEFKKNYGDLLLNPGCMTYRLFKMDAFAAELQTQGPYIVKAPGYGVGFDKLLESQPWQPLLLR
jgi:L-alanine-DL-glutamate epimerase and related enzymes of enolase superfamily